MRFEIKTGGWLLILIGLAGLSIIVFALGLFAGYETARNTAPEPQQAASVYPVPNPPPAEVATAPKPSVETPLKQSMVAKTAVKPKPASSEQALSMDKNAGPVAPPSSMANSSASMPKPPPLDSEESTRPAKSTAFNPPQKYASATDSSGLHHKPFNIQIDAVMDRANAEQMTTRLQKLGYHAFMVPTNISGQIWWRVRVGPYQSQDDASAAEQELRAKYKDTYAP